MTYSVVAAAANGEVGGASTSCVSGFSVGVIYAAVPGIGVVHAQARLNEDARDEAATRLGLGQDAPTILAAITDPSFDSLVEQRQFLIARPSETAVFTGMATGAYAGDRQGMVGDIRYVVAGNILTGAPVIERTEAAFVSGGCDLAERFVLALEAGAENGEGDSRCTPDRPATAAYMRLESVQGGAPKVEINVVDSLDPLGELRREYDAWRQDHPCPVPRDGEGGGGGAGGSAEVGGADPGPTEAVQSPAPDTGCSLRPGREAGDIVPLALSLALGLTLWRLRRRRARDQA